MSDRLDGFAHGIAENIMHSLTLDSDDGFHEVRQNFQLDNEETMDELPTSGENSSNAGYQSAVNEDDLNYPGVKNSAEMDSFSEILGNLPKKNTEARHLNVSSPSPESFPSFTDQSSKSKLETQKMITDISDDLCSKFQTILRSGSGSKAASEPHSKLTENPDIDSARGFKPENSNSVNVVDTQRREPEHNIVSLFETKIFQESFGIGHVDASSLEKNVVSPAETKNLQKVSEADELRIEERPKTIAGSDSSQKVEVIKDSMTKSIEVTDQGLKKQNIVNREVQSIPKVALVEKLPPDNNGSSENQELKQRRIGVSTMHCSLKDLDTSCFDQRNSIAFGLPKANLETSHPKCIDASNISPETRSINVSDQDKNVSDFVQQASSSSTKRRSDTQNEESNAKFRKRSTSSNNPQTGEKVELKHHRFGSVGSQTRNVNEEMKGTHGKSGNPINVKDFEALSLLQTRKRGLDEGLKTMLDEPSTSKKLKQQVESDLVIKDGETSNEDRI